MRVQRQSRLNRINWLYDAAGRLVGEAYDAPDTALDYIARYRYDISGNRIEKAVDKTPVTGDFTALRADFADLLYGMTGEEDNFQPTESTAYFYDLMDRLLAEKFDDGTTPQTTIYKYTAETGENPPYCQPAVGASTGIMKKGVFAGDVPIQSIDYFDTSAEGISLVSETSYAYEG